VLSLDPSSVPEVGTAPVWSVSGSLDLWAREVAAAQALLLEASREAVRNCGISKYSFLIGLSLVVTLLPHKVI